MQFRPPYRAAGDRVYQALKARLIAYDFPQGERIYLEQIAESLGVSTTPVREAMNRLAERNLVIKAPQKGFFAVTLSKENLLGHYELTRLLLEHELQALGLEAGRLQPDYQPIAVCLNRLHRRPNADATALARYSGDIFAAISSLRQSSGAVLAIEAANDHLYYIRTVECRYIDDVRSELILFCELLLGGCCDQLIGRISTYHHQRVQLLPKLIENGRRE
jgi:DNA-binding GntR family transcriptional regulator